MGNSLPQLSSNGPYEGTTTAPITHCGNRYCKGESLNLLGSGAWRNPQIKSVGD